MFSSDLLQSLVHHDHHPSCQIFLSYIAGTFIKVKTKLRNINFYFRNSKYSWSILMLAKFCWHQKVFGCTLKIVASAGINITFRLKLESLWTDRNDRSSWTSRLQYTAFGSTKISLSRILYIRIAIFCMITYVDIWRSLKCCGMWSALEVQFSNWF